MTSTGPTAPKRKAWSDTQLPRRRPPPWNNQNLDEEEESILPNQQIPPAHSPEEEEDHIGSRVEMLARELSDIADEKMSKKVSMEILENLALSICEADIHSWDDIAELTEHEKDLLTKTMSAGQAQVLRRLIVATQPRTQMPKPAKPQFPEINISSATQDTKSDWKDCGRGLMPTQDAVNFFTKLSYEAAAMEPPFTPYPAPDVRSEPWTPHALDVKRAIEAEVAKQKKYGVKKPYVRMDHMALAMIRMIVAGEIAGAWKKFGGLSLQLQNLTAILEISVKHNQEVAWKFASEQFRELQMLARDRHDPGLIKGHLATPDPAILARVAEDQNKEYKERTDKSRKEQPKNKKKDQPKRGKGSGRGRYEGRSRYYKDSDRNHDYSDKWKSKKRSRDDKDSEKEDRRSPKGEKAGRPRSKRRKKESEREKK